MARALSASLAAVEARIAAACARAGRPRSDVRLVGVTKGMEASVVRAAVAAGLSSFGENYVQEWSAKRAALGDLPSIEWHFIGRIQRNKAAAISEAALVHSVADRRVAAALAKVAESRSRAVHVLLQVNLDGEASKDGIAPEALADFLSEVRGHAWLRVDGLMVIPPPLDPESARARFRALRELRERHGGAAELPELSMGMSGDFETAIEEGATLVRVGTAIFGARPRKEDA